MLLLTLIKKVAFGYLMVGALFGVVQAIVEGPFTVLSGCLGWRDFFGVGGDAGSILGFMISYLRKMILWAPDLVNVLSGNEKSFLEWLAPRYVAKCG